ncbi:MAG: glycosyltransferase [Cytophagaceae bacterium]|jgi:glycosyltransferase involved in cell wall biosynthesis|nr:glycosyltransferase [Cytophagaceae bacterium]
MAEQKSTNLCDELVTFIALCYNQSAFAKESLNSIISQTWAPSHIYIIDDCSTDNSVAVIKEWIDETRFPATLICHPQNQGITRTMNEALSLCKTKYFHPWPCDDLMMPDKVESQLTYLENLGHEVGFLYGDIQWIDNDGNVTRESILDNRKKLFPNGAMPSGNVFPDLVKHGCFIPTASGLYVTKALNELGGFDENLYAEDWDMFMRIALKYGIAFKDQLFSKYRRHSSSTEMKKGAKYWDGHFKILPKYIGINREYDRLIWNKIGRDAIDATKDGVGGMGVWIWKVARKTANFKLMYDYWVAKRVCLNFRHC